MDIDQQGVLNSIQNSVYRTALKIRTVQSLCQLHLMDVSRIHRILPIRQCQTEKQSSLPLRQLLVLLKELFERVRLETPGQLEPKAPELTLNFLTAAYDRDGTGLIQPRSIATALIALSGDGLVTKYRALFRLYATSPGRKSSRGVHITRDGLRNLLTDLLQILAVVGESCNLNYVETAIRDCFSQVLTAAIGEERFLSWLQTEPAILLWLPASYRLSATEMIAHQVKCNICKTFPITGLRYQCLKCLNFNICQVCFFTGRKSKPHKKSHPVMEHCMPVSAKENTKLFFRTVRNNLFQGRCERKEAQRRRALMMTGEGDVPSHNSALSSSVPLISSEQLPHSEPFISVPSLGLPSSRPLGNETVEPQKTENHNKLQEDPSGQVLASLKVELIKTQESVKALHRESRCLRKQLSKWKGKAQLLHSAQEDRNCRLQASIHDLIASQESLAVEFQKVKQEIKNITERNEEALKERSFPNGPGCSLLKPSRSGYSADKSLDPTSCLKRNWRVGPQAALFSRNLESLLVTPRRELFPNAKPEADQHQNRGVRSVPLMPETGHPNQSPIATLGSPEAQESHVSEKGVEEEEEEDKEEKELQQLVLKLKDALSVQVQPGQRSALKEELLSAAEHVSRSFSSLVSQAVGPGKYTVHVDIPEELRQIPEKRPMLQIVRRLQEEHEIPEATDRVRNGGLPHLQQGGRRGFPAVGISSAERKGVNLAMAEERHCRQHPHEEKRAGESHVAACLP